MSWTTKALKKVLGQIAPQYFYDANDDWEPVKGEGGAINTRLMGSNVGYDAGKDAFKITHSDADIAIPTDLQFHGLAAEDTPIASGTGDLQGKAAEADLELVGFSMVENAATPASARVRLHKGTANTDPVLFDVTLAPGESVREYFSFGIKAAEGIYIDRVSGTTQITLFSRVVV